MRGALVGGTMSNGTFVDEQDQPLTEEPDVEAAGILCDCGTVTAGEATSTSQGTAYWSLWCDGCGENVRAEWDYYKGP